MWNITAEPFHLIKASISFVVFFRRAGFGRIFKDRDEVLLDLPVTKFCAG